MLLKLSYFGSVIEQCFSRRVEIKTAHAGLGIAIEHEIEEIVMSKNKAAVQQVKHNPIGHIEIGFSMFPIVDDPNQIKIIDLPHFDHDNRDEGDQRCSQKPAPNRRVRIDKGTVVRVAAVVTD